MVRTWSDVYTLPECCSGRTTLYSKLASWTHLSAPCLKPRRSVETTGKISPRRGQSWVPVGYGGWEEHEAAGVHLNSVPRARKNIAHLPWSVTVLSGSDDIIPTAQ